MKWWQRGAEVCGRGGAGTVATRGPLAGGDGDGGAPFGPGEEVAGGCWWGKFIGGFGGEGRW